MDSQILYLHRKDLDVKKWNTCITESSNGLVYGYAFYLDAMATNWDALVMGDYELVMPLPWRKKWGFYYLYQPLFTAQLGVFGNGITQKIINKFISSIPSHFRLWEFPLNAGNKIEVKPDFVRRTNYIMPLSEEYEKLYSSYRTQHKRNVKKALHDGLEIKRNIPVGAVIELARKNNLLHHKNYKYLHRFGGLFASMNESNNAEAYGVFTKNGLLLASALFLFSHNRAYYILVANNTDGRTKGASHYLIDAFIRDHAGSSLTLDFEGSDIAGIAFFYSGFGAVEEHYPAVRCNKLPFYLKWLKK